jgi:hypothetical protein
LAVLARLRAQVEDKGWADERLKVLLLEALALQVQGDQNQAVHQLRDALALAESAGFIRTFVDEGPPMAHLPPTTPAVPALHDSGCAPRQLCGFRGMATRRPSLTHGLALQTPVTSADRAASNAPCPPLIYKVNGTNWSREAAEN